jgi:hypothetical protein
MPRIGEVQFQCEYSNAERLKAAARESGWKDDDDYGPLDYVEPADFDEYESFPTLEAALRVADDLADKAYFGVVTIWKCVYRKDRTLPRIVEWKREHRWEYEFGELSDLGPAPQDDEE